MRPERMVRAILLALALLVPGIVNAQAPSCTIPAVLPRPHPDVPSDKQPRRLLPTAGYTLALSWAPEYCHAHRQSAASGVECGANHFGFTLHGLWPDGPGKDWPQYCRTAELLPDALIRANLCATPSPQLLQHEWAKHGTCVTANPAEFFATSTRLYRGIAYPDMEALSRRTLKAGEFAAAFAAANKGLSADMIRLNVNRRGWLEEVWICLGKDLAPRRCAATAGGAKPATAIKIERAGAATGRYRRRTSPSTVAISG